MSNKNTKLIDELQSLLAFLDEEPDVAAAIPIETVRAELQHMAIDTGNALSKLNELAQPGPMRIVHTDNPIPFAMASADATQNSVLPLADQLFPVTDDAVCIDGVFHYFLTNGDDVFVTLQEGEGNVPLCFDSRKVGLRISSDKTKALLVDYGRGKLLNFLDRMKREPGQHVIRWADPGRSDQHD